MYVSLKTYSKKSYRQEVNLVYSSFLINRWEETCNVKQESLTYTSSIRRGVSKMKKYEWTSKISIWLLNKSVTFLFKWIINQEEFYYRYIETIKMKLDGGSC